MKRYKHFLNHGRNTTFDMGLIVPIGRVHATRGETFMHSTSCFYRVSPLAYPVMHPVNIYTRQVHVPYDLIWEDFRDFISGGEDNTDASVHPYIDFSGSPVTAGSLANHLGFPVGFDGLASALPFRAYNLYWNEHVRDDQLQAKVAISLASGEDTTTSTALLNDNWDKDPFTSARPDDQLGTDVTLSLAGTAPVLGIGIQDSFTPYTTGTNARVSDGSTDTYTNFFDENGVAIEANGTGTTATPNIQADLSAATGISLSDLALAIQEGRLQEMINRKGNDYDDFLRRYGVKYDDPRLGRPKILATGKATIQFSEVLATAEGTNTNVGDMAGHGIGALKSNKYISYFKEDGLVLTLNCVKPIPMYTQSVDRTLTPMNRFEFYQKEYESVGMQEIPNKLVQFDHTAPEGTFGYEDRYNHLKKIPNTVHGQFAENEKDWHFARVFTGDQALNSSFITCNPTERVFLDTTQDHLKVMVKHNLKKLSPIKKYSPLILSNL
jgi:hypothetical protein